MSAQNNPQAAPQRALTAAQRLEQLEAQVINLIQVQDMITGDVQTIKEALRLLADKVSAIVTLSGSGKQLTNESINDAMVQANVDDLDTRLNAMIERGVLVLQGEGAMIAADSFVVGQEIEDKTGKVANPRIQFPLGGLKPEFRESLMGKKVGESAKIGDEAYTVEITRIYQIKPLKTAAQIEAEQAAAKAEASASEATSSEAASSEAASSEASSDSATQESSQQEQQSSEQSQ